MLCNWAFIQLCFALKFDTKLLIAVCQHCLFTSHQTDQQLTARRTAFHSFCSPHRPSHLHHISPPLISPPPHPSTTTCNTLTSTRCPHCPHTHVPVSPPSCGVSVVRGIASATGLLRGPLTPSALMPAHCSGGMVGWQGMEEGGRRERGREGGREGRRREGGSEGEGKVAMNS